MLMYIKDRDSAGTDEKVPN